MSSVETAPCGYCQRVHLHATEPYQVTSSCSPVHAMRTTAHFTLPTTMEWFYRRRHPSYKPLPPYHPSCPESREVTQPKMAILYPTSRSEIFLPRGLDGREGQAILEATHREPGSEIHWHLDDTYLGSTQGFHQVPVAPKPGPHLLTLVDETGARRSTQFTVLSAN